MAQPKDWLDIILDDQGRSYYYENGVVGVQSVPRWLNVGPDKWQDRTIKWVRNGSYHELFRNFTTPYNYVKDGMRIIRDQLINGGTERKLYHATFKLDKSFGGGWQHKLFYKSEIDLTRFHGEDYSVSVNMMEGGLTKLISANENTQYELDIDVPDARIIKHDGIELKQNATYLVTNGTLPNDLGGHTIATQMIANEAANALNATTQDRIKVGNTPNNLWDTSQRFLTTGASDTTITLNWDFNVFVSLESVGAIFGTKIFLQCHVLTDRDTRYNIPGLDSGVNLDFIGGGDPILLYNRKHNISGSFTFTVPANARCIFYMSASSNREFTYFTYDNDGTIDMDYNFRQTVSYVKGLTPMYVGQKLLDKMTGGGYQLTSNYISSEWNNLLITSGDALRGIPGAKLKTSWRDFYDSYNSVCNISGGVRGQAFTIERKANAYQQSVQLSLNEVSGFDDDIAYDYLYNAFKFGYPNTDTRDVNGRDEFNVTVNYTTQVTRVSKTLDLVSKYMASMYEIEKIRINLEGKKTTDGENDNTVFFIHTEATPTAGVGDEPPAYYKLLRNIYDSVTGLISPSTAYNIELHPELCMRRHGNWLHGVLWKMDGTDIVRETSDKNDRVVIIKNGQTYIGNKNTRIGTLDPALFVPILFRAEGIMPANTISVLENNPNGAFSFIYKGATYYGFPLETSIQPVDRPAQESLLLCSPQTDLNQLKRR